MTTMEEKIQTLYQTIGISSPSQLDYDYIASRLNIPLHIRDWDSKAVKFKGKYHIVLNENISEMEKWQDFGHELGHVLHHTGSQLIMPKLFRELQEAQANHFMMHFCVPTFMLLKLEFPTYRDQAINLISSCFNVTFDFAKSRLEQFETRMFGLQFYEKLAEASQSYKDASIDDDHLAQEIDLYEDTPPWLRPDFQDFINEIPYEYRDDVLWNIKSEYYAKELELVGGRKK